MNIDKNTQIILGVGLVAVVGYTVYKIVSPLSTTVKNTGGAISEATGGLGKGIGDTGVAVGKVVTDVSYLTSPIKELGKGLGENISEGLSKGLDLQNRAYSTFLNYYRNPILESRVAWGKILGR